MTKEFLLGSLQRLCRPLVGLCLRHGIKLGELLDAIKRVYVQCAEDSLHRKNETVSTSRITLMTGVHRTDVAAIRDEKSFVPKEHHTASNVINQWRYDPKFCVKPGKPRELEAEGKESEFAELVRSVSLSVSPYTVLFELERMEMVVRTPGNKIKLISRAFVPKGDPSAVLSMLGEDADDLFQSVEENAFTAEGTDTPHHHLKTEYSNISAQDYPKVKEWLMTEGSNLHERARDFLSQFDRDITPGITGSGKVRVALASFSRAEVLEEEKALEPKKKKGKK